MTGKSGLAEFPMQFKGLRILKPLAEGFCLRDQCERKRQLSRIDDRGPLTDLWWDIHRLKHNSRRVNHPTQLPPILLYRLISLFTQPYEMVLDCFNGSGTTTLAAHQIGRNFIGIEKSDEYYELTLSRHEEIRMGVDPFRKAERVLTAKNSRVRRMPKQKYKVPKKTLQLEVRRVARVLERLPTRGDMVRLGKYPIEYYDEYFASWGEVCAAARNNGMSETKQTVMIHNKSKQLHLFDS
jgi:site-specific DNA-methyltransferase (adenine-specific)